MAGFHHYPPARDYVIGLVRFNGARSVYGPQWNITDDDTIAMLQKCPPIMVSPDCDHYDAETGECLGHDRPEAA